MVKSNIGIILRRFYRRFAGDHVTLGSSVLPAKHLRLGGAEFKDDSYFLASAKAEADRLRVHCHYVSGQSVLDVGCGVGRLPIGILAQAKSLSGYVGVDVDPAVISWCEKYLKSGASFHAVNVLNQRYNPGGAALSGNFHFPFRDHSFDVLYLYSVFSHMLPDDINVYLAEFHRLMKTTGTLFFTAFAEDGVPDVSENPPDYRMRWSSPLHCVRYEKSFLTRLLARQGFRISRFDYAQETDGQSAFYCHV
jgi:SAM-dependent methyltransferase